jgi:hypothetical protein
MSFPSDDPEPGDEDYIEMGSVPIRSDKESSWLDVAGCLFFVALFLLMIVVWVLEFLEKLKWI